MDDNYAAFSGEDTAAVRWFSEQPHWWTDHYIGAVDQLVDFLSADGISLDGSTVIDLGCGDGTITFGIGRRTGVERVIGTELFDVDISYLNALAERSGIAPLRDNDPISFAKSADYEIPAADQSADLVVAWSVFEHVEDSERLLKEVWRVLKPNGRLFIQIWPMFGSEHGSHLWPWLKVGFQQNFLTDEEIRNQLNETISDELFIESLMSYYRTCNRISLDELQRCIRNAHLYISKVSLQGDTFHVPPELQDFPLTNLGISGIKILATRQ